MSPYDPPEKTVWTANDLGSETARLFDKFANHGGDIGFLLTLWMQAHVHACEMAALREKVEIARRAKKLAPRIAQAEARVRALEAQAALIGARPPVFPSLDGPERTAAEIRKKFKYWMHVGRAVKITREGRPARLFGRALFVAGFERYASQMRPSTKAWQKAWLSEWLGVIGSLPLQPATLEVISRLVDKTSSRRPPSRETMVSAFTRTLPDRISAAVIEDPLKWWKNGSINPIFRISRKIGQMIAASFLRGDRKRATRTRREKVL